MNLKVRPILVGVSRSLLILVLVLLPTSSNVLIHFGNHYSAGTEVEMNSAIPDDPPQIDGIITPGEWEKACLVHWGSGVVYIQNDAANLYLAYARGAGIPDFGSDSGKMDQIGLIINGKQVRPNQAAATQERIWEVAISLAEIGAAPGDLLHLGLQFSSSQPKTGSSNGASGSKIPGLFISLRLVRPSIELLVLAHQDFLKALIPFKTYKDETGMATYVQSWQSLASSFHAQGRDDAERIKRGISAYYRYAEVHYVMLVGDGTHFPVRYSITEHDNENIRAGWTFIPTDYYYADLLQGRSGLFNSWDANQNGYFGELNGEKIDRSINIDGVGTTPTVAVGRVPAATAAEVSLYVEKIIIYERNAYQASWVKRAAIITTTDWVLPACQIANSIANQDLSPQGYQVIKLFEQNKLCASSEAPSSGNILRQFNQGIGFVSYFGHGSRSGWSIPGDAFDSSDLEGLKNLQKLPIVFTAGCNTASFGVLPPQQPYMDTRGTLQVSWSPKNSFSLKPEQPADLQPAESGPSFGAQLLVKHSTGAVAYLGAATSSQFPAYDLARFFFSTLDQNPTTLGDMWSAMIRQYYQAYSPAEAQAIPAWYRVALFQQPWKFNLLGDPSLRIKGVAPTY
jgi:hypothetical protein